MIKILEDSIDFSRLGNYEKKDIEIDIRKAVISRESRTLTLELVLNFVLPYEAIDKFKRSLTGRLRDVHEVKLDISYEGLVQTKEEAMAFYIEHMIALVNGRYAHVTRTIYTDNWELADGKLLIYALGELSVEILNKEVAGRFRQLLKRDLDLDVEVVFRNNSDVYRNAGRMMEERERAVFDAHREKVAEALHSNRERAASGAASPGGSGAPGGMPGASNGWAGQSGGPNKRKKKGYVPVRGNVIMGEQITGMAVPISDIHSESGTVVVEGELFNKDCRTTRSDSKLVSLFVTDKRTSICVKAFVLNQKWEDIDTHLGNGDGIRIKGQAQWDRFDNCVTVMADSIEKIEKKERMDTYPEKRVELHAHTKMSAMDGLNDVKHMVKTAEKWGHKAVAVTDHGVVQAFPDASHAAKDIKILYGCEGYLLDDRDLIDEDGNINYKGRGTNHVIIFARNRVGLKNLYKLVSMSHLEYFYKRPRIPKSVLTEYREGLIIGSACEAGEVYSAIMNQKSDEEIERLVSFYDYLEIQPLINNRFMLKNGRIKDEEELRENNRKIVALGEKYNKPVVATCDAHYFDEEEALYRRILMAGQGFKDVEGDEGLYFRTTNEMMEEFSYLGEETAYKVVIENTNRIADMIEPMMPVPDGKFPPKIDGAEDDLRRACEERATDMYGSPLPQEIRERLDKELNSIIDNGYAVMYRSAEMLVKKSLSDGYLVGSRGSVGSSFAATMSGITEVNPLPAHYLCPNCKHLEWGDKTKYDCGVDMPDKVCPECGTPYRKEGFTIPFETFLGFEANKEPDIDLNFAGEYQGTAHKYVEEIFGSENVYKAGTIGTIKDKTAYGYVAKYFEERGMNVNKFEMERLSSCCEGVRRTSGQHPGGIIIVPRGHEIYEFCPVQHPANDVKSDIVTTHFDYHSIDQNLLKLDILGHDAPSMIRQLQDMTGVDPLKVPIKDEKVMSIFIGIEGLDIKDPDYKFTHGSYGIPEFGTKFVRQMLDDIQPTSFEELVRISGLSHGTDVWLGNAQELIVNGVTTMKEAIATRDDIMNYLRLKGLPNRDAFTIMEKVRKGKGLTEEQETLMREHDVPEWYIDSCKKIKYMFPRAHAVAYVMMSSRIAYYKVYHPVEFYAVYFTAKVANFDEKVMLKGQHAIEERLNDIISKGKDASKKEEDDIPVLEVAYEMCARGYEFTPARLGISDSVRFLSHEGKVLLPFVAITGVGEGAAKTFFEEYQKRPYETVEDVAERGKINKTALDEMRQHGVLDGLPETAQISLFG
ncbi:MAG: PolC-type DNA polymerase III [Firmicutes bacterium]|nr:PolC-type DNA polymerase III [Bacillota bacterium]